MTDHFRDAAGHGNRAGCPTIVCLSFVLHPSSFILFFFLLLSPSAFPLPPSYDSFPLVHTRNVFDPDRRPPRPAGAATPAPAPDARPDYAALTGTLVNAEKTYAFFSGSRPEFNKVLTVQDKIADGIITAITPLSIEFERAGKRTLVAVGQTVPLNAEATPGPAPAPAAITPTVTAASASQPAVSNPQPASAAKLEEIRQRMMQKRQQDLK